MKKKLRNIEKSDAAAVKRMQRPQVTEDSSTVILSGEGVGGGYDRRAAVLCGVVVLKIEAGCL